MNIRHEYFEWLCSKVMDNHTRDRFENLLQTLHHVEFIPIIEMDENRESDGIDIRYRFSDEHDPKLSVETISKKIDILPTCSVLELMIALAVRCEENIMCDDEYGDRTKEWFWNMLKSLGLDSMNNESYNDQYVMGVLSRFIDRKYEYNGKGGLFTLQHPPKDLRKVEIWYQMCWYIDEILGMV